MKYIRRITHKFILWYTRRVAGGDFHTNPYGPEGRYIVCMTEAQYHRYRHLAEDEPVPGVFEAHGLEWYRHDKSGNRPPQATGFVMWIVSHELEGTKFDLVTERAEDLRWDPAGDIIGWRPADAPAKLLQN